MEHVSSAMRKSGKSMEHLRGIIVTRGPGSFTSTRVGLAVAYGLRLALKIPVLALSSLEALLLSVPPFISLNAVHRFVVILPSHKEWVYSQAFSLAREPLDCPKIRNIHEIDWEEETLFVGSEVLKDMQPDILLTSPSLHLCSIHARFLLRYAHRLTDVTLEDPLEPLIERPPSCA
jgi:tRNA threonylcarbamoyl adenosine modification protein YeaZ